MTGSQRIKAALPGPRRPQMIMFGAETQVTAWAFVRDLTGRPSELLTAMAAEGEHPEKALSGNAPAIIRSPTVKETQ